MNETETPKKKSKLPLILAIVVLLLAAGGGAAYYFMFMGQPTEEDAEGEQAEAPPQPLYHSLEPAFVANLAGPDSSRYLQIEVDVMAYSQEAIDAVQQHDPAIRNSLMLLFGSQRAEPLQERAGKEALQQGVLEAINEILVERANGAVIEEVYFSSFVMQ